MVLRLVHLRLGGRAAPLHLHVAGGLAAALGALLFAGAPSPSAAVLGVLLVSGLADPIVRVAATIWVDRRTSRPIRATVHSFLSQAEQGGEAACGLALGALAGLVAVPTVLMVSAALFVAAAAVAGATARRLLL